MRSAGIKPIRPPGVDDINRIHQDMPLFADPYLS